MDNRFDLRQFTLTMFIVWLCLPTINAQNYFPIKKGQKWGLMDEKGTVFLQPIYDAISEFDQYGYAVIQQNNKIGLIDRKAKKVLVPIFDEINVLNANLFAVKRQTTWQVINKEQEVILDHEYEEVSLLEGGEFLIFKQEKKWGLVHISGRIVSEALYEVIIPKSNGFFLTRSNKKLGLIHESGQVVLKPSVNKIKIHNTQFVLFKKGEKWGLIRNSGKIVVEPAWDFHLILTDNFIKFKKDNKAALFVLSTEQMISKGDFDDFYKYTESTVLVKKGVKVGLMNTSGQLLLDTKYDEILDFRENQYRVRNQQNWGVVQVDDIEIIPQEYSYITPLNSSVCAVRQGRLFGIANFKGEIEVPLEYDKIQIENNSAKAYKGKALKTLFFNTEGELEETNEYKIKGSIKIGKKQTRRVRNGMFNRSDFRMENFEWFYSPLEDKWGLRNTKTGIEKIPPTYHRISVHRNLGFTIVGLEKRTRQDFERTGFRFEYVFGIVNNKHGLLVSELNMIDIQTSDFYEKKLPAARVVFSSGRHGLMEKNGRILHKDYAYIGEFENGLARMSPKGNLTGSFKDKSNNLGELKDYLNNMDSPNEMTDYTNYDSKFLKEAVLKCEKCTWGYMDTMGKIVIQPMYSFVRDFKKEVAIIKKENKWGVISTKNEPLLNCSYNDIQFLENTNNEMLSIYVTHAQYGLIDSNGHTIIPVEYEGIGKVQEGLVAVKKNGRWGFCNVAGKEVVSCQYTEVEGFSEGYAAVKKGRKWGLIDAKGTEVFPIKYKAIGNVKSGMVWVKEKRLYEYYTTDNQKAFEGGYDKAFDFQGDIAKVKLSKYFGLINQQGQIILKPKDYIALFDFDENDRAIARLDNNKKSYVLLNRLGERLGNQKFQEIYAFREGFAGIRYRNQYGFINTDGAVIVEAIYDNVGDFSNGMATVKVKNKWGFVNKEGQLVIKPQFSKCLDFQNGLAVVYHGYQKSGLVNQKGEFIIKPVVNRILDYSSDKGLVRNKESRYYFINSDNKLFKGHYQKATPYKNNVAAIKREGKWGVINKKGIEIVPPKYARIGTFEKGFAPVRINSFSGVSNLQGKIIVDTSYEYISYAGKGVFRVERGDKMGYFNSKGNWVWDLD